MDAVDCTVLPLPRRTTGVRRSRRNSSRSEPSWLLAKLVFLLAGGRLGMLLTLLSVLGERKPELLAVLPLRPRNPNLPYPSWPVPAAGPFTGCRLGRSVTFGASALGLREKMLKRGDLLGLGGGPMAGESLRKTRRSRGGGGSGIEPRANWRADGGGEMAESTRGDACREEVFDDSPKRALNPGEVAVGDTAVSCEGVRL